MYDKDLNQRVVVVVTAALKRSTELLAILYPRYSPLTSLRVLEIDNFLILTFHGSKVLAIHAIDSSRLYTISHRS